MGFAETFKALSDPIRREILMMLRDGSMSAREIGSHFDMTGATISYHLKILKKAELIFEKKEKNYIYYTLNTSVASTGGNTFWKKRRGRSIQQQIICSSRNLSVFAGSAYFM